MTIEQLKQVFHERGIRHVKLGVFDLDGVLRGKYVSPEKFFSAAEGGLGFCDVIFGWDSSDALYDNVSVTGWHTGYPDTREGLVGKALIPENLVPASPSGCKQVR